MPGGNTPPGADWGWLGVGAGCLASSYASLVGRWGSFQNSGRSGQVPPFWASSRKRRCTCRVVTRLRALCGDGGRGSGRGVLRVPGRFWSAFVAYSPGIAKRATVTEACGKRSSSHMVSLARENSVLCFAHLSGGYVSIIIAMIIINVIGSIRINP